ncbi:MAG: rhombosortase [Pseudomonadales bacterium]|nr:rhombosortase [Pseudomonadales bacterium]
MSSASIRLIAFLYLIVLSTQYIGIDNFWFARDLIAKGQWWRLVSAHFIHANSVHLLLNMSALALILALFDRVFGTFEWLVLIMMSAIIQSLAMYFYMPQVVYYVGFSGVIHSLYVAGTVKLITNASERVMAFILLCLVTLKLLTESLEQGISVTEKMIGSHVLTEAHLMGAVIGLAFSVGVIVLEKIQSRLNS